MQGFTTINLIILVVYLTTVLFARLYFSKKEMKGKGFFKGDGTIPWWVIFISVFAILLGPISFLPLAGDSYAGAWIMWFAQLGVIVAISITIKFFLLIYSKLDINTAYHYLEIRFRSKGLRVLGAVVFTAYQVGRMSVIMCLPPMVLANLTGINVNVLIITMSVIAITYSHTGGLKSVLWADFIQGGILLISVIFTLFYLVGGTNGGFGAIFQSMAESKFLASDQPIFNPNILKDSVFLLIAGTGLNTCSSHISSQDIVQRFTTTTGVKKLNKMMLASGALSIFIATVFCLTGTGLYVFYGQNALPPTAQQDQIFASYIAYQLPVGITGLPLAAIYAASQSILSTGLNSVATDWTLNTQGRLSRKKMSLALQIKVAQYVSLGVGVMAILTSMILANGEIKSAYEWFNGFMGLVLGMLGGTFALDTFTEAANAKGAYVTFFVAAVTMIYIRYMAPAGSVSIWFYSIISIVISLVVGIPVSVTTRKLDGDTFEPVKDTTIYHS